MLNFGVANVIAHVTYGNEAELSFVCECCVVFVCALFWQSSVMTQHLSCRWIVHRAVCVSL